VNCNDPLVRDGLKAMLANKLDEAESHLRRRGEDGWTAHQIADDRLLEQLRAASGHGSDLADQRKLKAALDAFHKNAYQWF